MLFFSECCNQSVSNTFLCRCFQLTLFPISRNLRLPIIAVKLRTLKKSLVNNVKPEKCAPFQ